MVKRLFKKMLPAQILSNLAMTICIQLDIIMIGQFLGVNGVSAYGLANPILLFLTALTGLFSMGITVLCSKLVGKGDSEGIKSQFSSVLLVVIGISVLFTLLLYFGKGYIVELLGAEKGTTLYDDTLAYLKGYLIGIPAYFVLCSLTSYLHIAGKRELVIISIIVMTVLDIVFDILAGTVLNTGMFGMGIATTISEIGSLLVVLIYFFNKNCMFKFSFNNVKIKPILDTMVGGLPIAVNQVCFTICAFIFNRLLLKYGNSDSLAISSVLNSICTLVFAGASGIGGTTQILSGMFFGEEDKENIVNTLKEGIKWDLIIIGSFLGLIMIFARPLASIYLTGNEKVLDESVPALRMFACMTVPLSLNVICKNYYPCVKKLYLAIVISLLENFAFMIGCYFLFSKLFGLTGLWISQFWSEILSNITIIIITQSINKKLMVKVDDLTLLDNDFSIPDECVATFAIKCKEDLSTASEGAGKFCLSFGTKKSTANYISLCIEEMAADIIERSFKNGKNHEIQVKLCNKDDCWIIRIRDNCETFDTASYLNLHKTGDDISHLGIRMVFRLVTEAKYINSLGFNCLTLKINKNK